jgi:hypothetical protein
MSAAVRRLKPRRDPRDVGERVLAALDAGREKHNAERAARAKALRALISDLARLDAENGLPRLGRVARIARRLKGHIGASKRNVRRILVTLSSTADRSCRMD